VEAIVMSYIEAINCNKVHFTLLVDSDSTLVPEETIRSYGSDLVYIPPYQHPLAYQNALFHLFKERHFDIVHAHINTMSVFPLFAAWRAGIPIRIVHNHSTAGHGQWRKNILKYMLRPFAKIFATQLCACGQYAGEWLFGKKTPFLIMPNSIDFNGAAYEYNPQLREEMRRELGLEGCLVVGHVGRFIPEKNHTFLVDVFTRIHQVEPKSKLLLVGSGNLMPSIKRKVMALGLDDAVIFAGQRSDVPALYQAMDIMLMPSLYEGKPLVPMEAQIAGLHVIAANNISKEIILREDLVHFISLKESAETWAECVERIIPFTNVNNRFVHCDFQRDDATKRLEQFYMDIMNRQKWR